MSVKAARAIDLAVVDPPENLEPAVDALDGSASLVEPFELLGGSGNAWESPQIDLLLDAHGQAIVAFAVAGGVARTGEALLTGGATVFQRAAVGFMADVRHRVPHGWIADLVIAEDRAGLIVNDVERRSSAQHFLG